MTVDKVLAIETSCDDTSVAIVNSSRFVVAQSTANQDLMHKPYGGIVPEIAGRSHSEALLPLIENLFEKSKHTWADISGIVVTNRPGLVGSLLVGLVTAKTLALTKNLPFVGINHIEGHIWAPFLRDDQYESELMTFPFLSLVVSGGHSHIIKVSDLGQYEVVGKTLDDAAGEAFDKFAKMLGLGYPGGAKVDQLAVSGNAKAFEFPRPMIHENNFNFSFSGLKTSALNLLEKLSENDKHERASDLCASYQAAIVDVLAVKLERAGEALGIDQYCVTGGVSANSGLRQRIEKICEAKNYNLQIPPLRYCTDNAAMIGLAGLQRLLKGQVSEQDLGPQPKSLETDFFHSLSKSNERGNKS